MIWLTKWIRDPINPLLSKEFYMKSKYKSLLKDTAIFAVGNMGSKMILFLLVPLYTNCLTKEEYGISELVFTLAQLLTPFFTVAIHEAILDRKSVV